MINRLIEWSLRNRFLVGCAIIFLVGFGIRAVFTTPVDAIPDLSENQVVVFADWMGRSPQEVEDQVTYPLSVNLQGLAGVKTVRANSMFGFSLITIIFEDRIDNYFARQRVLERLNYLGGILPEGVEAFALDGRNACLAQRREQHVCHRPLARTPRGEDRPPLEGPAALLRRRRSRWRGGHGPAARRAARCGCPRPPPRRCRRG